MIFEGSLLKASSTVNDDETPLFRKLSNVIKVFLCLFLVLRIGEVVWHGKLPLVLAGDRYSWLFITEIVLLALPLVMLQSTLRHSARGLFVSAVCLLLGAALWRMNYSLIAYDPGNGYHYFPTTSEILISIGFVAVEIAAYVLLTRLLPILPAQPSRSERIKDEIKL